MAEVSNGDVAGDLDVRLANFRQTDEQRESFIKDIIAKYLQLQKSFKNKCDDLESEIMSRRGLQTAVGDLKRDYFSLRQQTESNGFVLALIDGDGAIFRDNLLKNGAEGGSEAGFKLLNEIRQHVQDRHENASASWAVIVQIYCNFDGLSRKLVHVGLLKSPSDFVSFAREFNLSQPLFSLVDVGSGKERADHKIREMFRLYVSNIQCKHIIFGGCHDNGYLPNLEPFRRDNSVVERMTLLETTPAESSYKQLGYPIARFPSVFKSEPLPGGVRPPNTGATPFTVRAASPQNTSARPELPALSPGNPAQPSTVGHPPKITASATATYANVGYTDGTKEISVAPLKGSAPQNFVLLNAYDQRLDPVLPRIDPQTMAGLHERIKRSKLCNSYHLSGHCALGNRCPYDHNQRLSLKEQIALRYKARGLCCPAGDQCRDFNCYLGHQCPRGSFCKIDECYFGDLHDVDATEATKQYEDGRIIVLSERVHR